MTDRNTRSGQRRKEQNSKRSETPNKEPSMWDLFKIAERNAHTLEDNTAELKTISRRMERLENRLTDVEERVAILEDREDEVCTKDELSSTVKSIQVDLAEQRRQLHKKDNAIVFGIPESADGQLLFDELMKILLPKGMDGILTSRIGLADKKDRPILLRTGNSNIKTTMFSNLSKLKDIDQFRSVSVQHDCTRLQRIAKAAKRSKTNPKSKGAGKVNAEKVNAGDESDGSQSDDETKEPRRKKSRRENKNKNTVESNKNTGENNADAGEQMQT